MKIIELIFFSIFQHDVAPVKPKSLYEKKKKQNKKTKTKTEKTKKNLGSITDGVTSGSLVITKYRVIFYRSMAYMGKVQERWRAKMGHQLAWRL